MEERSPLKEAIDWSDCQWTGRRIDFACLYVYYTLRKDDHEPLACGGTAAPSSAMFALYARECSEGVR